jgi:acyl-CoA hydrolase
LSRGGRAVIALPSTAKGCAVSRIVPELAPGAGVVTTRGHAHWVVTEYGAVDLHGRTLRERAAALIGIAHPDVRGELMRWAAGTRHYLLWTVAVGRRPALPGARRPAHAPGKFSTEQHIAGSPVVPGG